MAVNQPIIGSDQADNSWKLEVTAQANTEESRVNALVSRIEQLEAMLGATTTGSGGVVQSVNTEPPSILRLSDAGRLSTIPVTGAGSLAVLNLVQRVSPTSVEYNFTRTIPETHILYVGGMKLVETVDYNLANQDTQPGILTLTSIPANIPTNNLQSTTGIHIELSIWSI